ncbi:hypothetical protein EON65_06925 [archaeon]|nr:MAG: hypothetical protein EON65_06925 [archaeon]
MIGSVIPSTRAIQETFHTIKFERDFQRLAMRASILSGQKPRDDGRPPPIPVPDKFRVAIGNVIKKPFVPVLPAQIKSDTTPASKPNAAVFGVNNLVSLLSKPFKIPTGCTITEK